MGKSSEAKTKQMEKEAVMPNLPVEAASTVSPEAGGSAAHTRQATPASAKDAASVGLRPSLSQSTPAIRSAGI